MVPSEVSVVIPAYNCEPYIRQAIDSVFAQSQPPLEVIVVDDGSTDGTAEVLQCYGDSIKHIYQRNQGVSVARNTGIGQCTGRYVAFLDADDAWFKDKLLLQMKFLQARDDISAVFSDFQMADESGKVYGTGAIKNVYPIFSSYGVDWPSIFPNVMSIQTDGLAVDKPVEGEEILGYYGRVFESLFRGNFVKTSSVVVRRKILDEIGGFEPSRHTQEDYELWLKIFLNHQVAYLDTPLLFYRRRAGQLTGHAESENIHRISTEVLLGFEGQAREACGDDLVNERLSRKYQALALSQLRFTARRVARSSLRRSLSHKWTMRGFVLYLWTFVPNSLDRPIREFIKRLLRRSA